MARAANITTQQDLLIAHYKDKDLSVKEIARLMEIAPSTVYARLKVIEKAKAQDKG